MALSYAQLMNQRVQRQLSLHKYIHRNIIQTVVFTRSYTVTTVIYKITPHRMNLESVAELVHT
jgi:hypothetical protein